jgi:hypothetical protein
MDTTMTDEDSAFLELVAVIREDLIDHGYTPADDGEDNTTVDNYRVMFTHWEEDTQTLYVCRHSEQRTVLIDACEFKIKEIFINSLEDWVLRSKLMTEERGLPLESQTEEEDDEPTPKAPAGCVICAELLGTMTFTCPACNNACCHLACISKWAHRASTCPLCRAELPPAVAPPRDVAHLLPTFLGTNAVHYIITDSADDAGFAMVNDALALSLAIESDHQARAQAPTTSFASPASADGTVADPSAHIDAELDAAARLIAPVYRI